MTSLELWIKYYFFLAKWLENCVSDRQISRLSIMHSKFALLYLHVTLGSHDLNALSAQRVCSTSVSAYGVCILCLSCEFLCVKCEEKILLKLFEPILRDS